MHFAKSILFFSSLSLIESAVIKRHNIHQRDTAVSTENVIITEQVNVVQHPDGSLVVGAAFPVQTHVVNNPEVSSEETGTTDNDNDDNDQDEISDSTPIPAQEIESHPESQSPPEPQSHTSPESKLPVTLSEQKSTPASSPASQPVSHDRLAPAPPVSQPKSAPVAPPASPSKPAPTAQSNNGKAPPKSIKAGGGGKRGVAYNDANKLQAFSSSSKVSWAYNWEKSAKVAANMPSNMEYVPMCWGTGIHSTGWHEAANRAIEGGSTHLLAFNEPDLGAQSALSVPDAVIGYRALMQPYAGRARLGSPAVTNGGDPMGLTYLKNFIEACTGCTIDFVAIHWYNGGTANDFKNHVAKAHEVSGGRPVWITEFEGSGDAGQQQAFLNDVMPWLDSQDYVERYAYFMASDGNLISSGTSLSSVGQAFAYGG